MNRFVCPKNPDHDDFYLRHSSSVAHDVHQNGTIGDEIKNSYDGEGIGPVMCGVCNDGVEAVDTLGGEPPLEWA